MVVVTTKLDSLILTVRSETPESRSIHEKYAVPRILESIAELTNGALCGQSPIAASADVDLPDVALERDQTEVVGDAGAIIQELLTDSHEGKANSSSILNVISHDGEDLTCHDSLLISKNYWLEDYNWYGGLFQLWDYKAKPPWNAERYGG